MKTIKLNHITKIEGHASLHVKIKNNMVEECELHVVEGARFFEGLLKNRYYHRLKRFLQESVESVLVVILLHA